jgi:hypothetical protein
MSLKNYCFSLCLLFLALLSFQNNSLAASASNEVQGKIYKVTDFGAFPNDGKEDSIAIKAAIKAVRKSSKPATLLFKSGCYDLKNDESAKRWNRMITAAVKGTETWAGPPPQGIEGRDKDKNTILYLSDIEDLTIEGSNSTLMVHGLAQPFSINNCKNLTVKNFKINWQERPSMTGRVLQCKDRYIDVEIIDGQNVKGGEPFIAIQVFDPKTKLPTALETFAGVQNTELLRKGVLRINLTSDGRGNALAGKPKKGQLFAMRIRLSGYEPIDIRKGKNITLKNIDIYTGIGMGIVAAGVKDITLDTVRIIPEPKSNSLVSTTADATHFINCLGTIRLNNCHFSGMGDDHLNVHGQYHFVSKVINSNTIQARIGTLSGHGKWHRSNWIYDWTEFPEAGESVEFCQVDNLNIFHKAVIKKIEFDRETGRSTITFDKPLPDIVRAGCIFQPTERIPALRISGCYFGPNRSRGTLVTTRDAIIENCVFDRNGGSPIFICCEVDWLESPAPENITIRNNVFNNCGYAVANEGAAVTVLFKKGNRVEGKMKNITIENNTFRGQHRAGILAKQIDNMKITGNIFEHYKPAIILDEAKNVNITDNIMKLGSSEIKINENCDKKTIHIENNTIERPQERTTQNIINAPDNPPKPERPWIRQYHQTLTMKLFLCSVKFEGKNKRRDIPNSSQVFLTFEEALEVIRKMDNLSRGIPKIVYLVGWHYDGHDSKYPAWFQVNKKLKRPKDKTAIDSLKWLIREARTYNTTVSFHVNMLDAYDDSPLWDTYVENDIIAKNLDGTLREGEWGWPISYAQEWKTGYAQKRIDWLCQNLPVQKAATIHVDAFHSWVPIPPSHPRGPISPYLGFTVADETQAQRNIFRYWRDKGIDVTSEGLRFLRDTAFEGLQPMAWWFNPSQQEYMNWPASYYTGGIDRSDNGKLFGTSIHGEEIAKKDSENLTGFIREFCLNTLCWYYLNRHDRLRYIEAKNYRQVDFSDGLLTHLGKSFKIIDRGYLLRENDDVFMPALWRKNREIIAYSANGYTQKRWSLLPEWKDVKTVDIYEITLEGLKNSRIVGVDKGTLQLSMQKDQAIAIMPSKKSRDKK